MIPPANEERCLRTGIDYGLGLYLQQSVYLCRIHWDESPPLILCRGDNDLGLGGGLNHPTMAMG
jgi:hypothetical protein